MNKKFAVFLSTLLCCFLGGMALVSLILPKQTFSPMENRYLQKAPALTPERVMNGSFMTDVENYVSDHIAGRDLWVAMKAWNERLSGKQENNGVYFGKQDTLINRVDHSQSGAMMAFRILKDMGAQPEEIATIVTAIGNHDEGTGVPVNPIAAALILADKSDVRRSRVRNPEFSQFDIHDRVNYSVRKSVLKINEEHTIVKLKLLIDTKYGSVMDYFEILLNRMILCRKAAERKYAEADTRIGIFST